MQTSKVPQPPSAALLQQGDASSGLHVCSKTIAFGAGRPESTGLPRACAQRRGTMVA
jgi:hypothetical protein